MSHTSRVRSSLPAHSFLSNDMPGLAHGAELCYGFLTFSHFGLPFGIFLKPLRIFRVLVYQYHFDFSLSRQKNRRQ
jgi:hypothetical protein